MGICILTNMAAANYGTSFSGIGSFPVNRRLREVVTTERTKT